MNNIKVAEAIAERRSIRAFKDDPVPQDLLMSILESARNSASNCNTQPWHLSIVSGDARDRLAKALVAEVSKGNPANGAFVSGMTGLKGTYKERQYECAACLYGTMGIAREDKNRAQRTNAEKLGVLRRTTRWLHLHATRYGANQCR